MSLLECFSSSPCIKVLLFVPDCETDVVAEWVCRCKWIDACFLFVEKKMSTKKKNRKESNPYLL